jgi:dihydrofolate reductase
MPGHQEAINYLQQKRIDEVIVGGGTAVYNHFINNNLVTNIYFNYVPVLIGDGGVLGTANDLLTNFRVTEYCLLEGDILQMHFSRKE